MVTGKGSENALLTRQEIEDICSEALGKADLDGKKILAIIPDHTRTAPIDVMFDAVYRNVAGRAKMFDVLIALGTHHAMPMEAIYERVGITAEKHKAQYPKTRFFNHRWDDPAQLKHIGTISREEISELSGGRMDQEVRVILNKMLFDYDMFMIIGPTFPHEVVGFSGGYKYLFPGVAAAEIINLTHWLGALITNPAIIGTKDTPVRRVIHKAASFLPMARLCLSLVVKGEELAGLYVGSPEEAFSAAADLSDKVHITYHDRPYRQVLSCAPTMYDELWTGGKCMYKLEPVVADGGELIIYAPHITEIALAHGKYLREIGYHVRDYFVKQWDKFKDVPGGVMAHSSHVKGIGTYENGVEKPRVEVILATGIPRDVCKAINLGYRDPASINVDDFKDREDEGILYVKKAGEMLYRLKNDPFRN